MCVSKGQVYGGKWDVPAVPRGEVNVSVNGARTITNVQLCYKDTLLDNHIEFGLSPHGLNEIDTNRKRLV